jgi:2,4-dienoyl-CoA reductase-like NADH-dependent reductase (Old Yellow Enzyme family)
MGIEPHGAAPDVFAPARLGPVTLRNRVVKAATFEGLSPKNLVSDALIEFHRRAAAGGLGMTTVSYVAVSPDGMGAPNEIYVRDEARPGLTRIAEAVHAEGAAIAAQLGHAGPVGALPGKTPLGPSAGWTPMGTRIVPITTTGIDAVVEDFARGALTLADCGFDSVEVHLGHGYLPSSFMSPRLNRRTDDYGGTTENRARLAREILRAVRDAVGQRIAVTAKMNMSDGKKGGLDLPESIEIARLIEADGVLDALELTGGSSLQNPMFLFRGDVPRTEFAAVLPPVQRTGFKLFGRFFLKAYPFEELYFLPLARRFREALTMDLILLGGINTLASMQRAMAEGFQFVAMGRALLREPDLLKRMQDGTATGSTCIHCNKCMVSIYSGTRCVVDHPDPILVRR